MTDETISRQAALDILDNGIRLCDKALSTFGISLKDEYAVKVEKASLLAHRKELEQLPTAQPEIPDVIAHLKKRLYETAVNNVGVKCDADVVYSDIAEKRLEAWMNEIYYPGSHACAV